MNEEQRKSDIPEMTERRTQLPDGRYLIFYEFDASGELSTNSAPSDDGSPPKDV